MSPALLLRDNPADHNWKQPQNNTIGEHPMPSIADSPTSARSEMAVIAATASSTSELMPVPQQEAQMLLHQQPMVFASEQHDLRQFLACHALPQIVSITVPVQLENAMSAETTQNGGDMEVQKSANDSLNGNIDLQAPILLYRSYTPQRCEALAYCRPLHLQLLMQEQQKAPPLRLFIPEAYPGWFSVVDDNLLRSTAKRYTTLQSLLQDTFCSGSNITSKTKNSQQLLVHGSSMPAFRRIVAVGVGETHKFEPVVVASGSVLTLVGIHSRQSILFDPTTQQQLSPPQPLSATLLLDPQSLLNSPQSSAPKTELGLETTSPNDNLYNSNNPVPFHGPHHRHHHHHGDLPNFLSAAKQQVRTTSNDDDDHELPTKQKNNKRTRTSAQTSSSHSGSALAEFFRRAKRSLFGGNRKQQHRKQKSTRKTPNDKNSNSPYAPNDIIYTSTAQPPSVDAIANKSEPKNVALVATAEAAQDQLLAKCLVNEHDMDVYVPLSTAATLFCISAAQFDPQCLMPLNLILTSLTNRNVDKTNVPTSIAADKSEVLDPENNKLFPLHVKLVSGFVPPQMPKEFSGYMTILTCHSCNVVMGCTMPTTATTPVEDDVGTPTTLFELDIDEAAFRVRRAKLDPLYCLDVRYRRALRHAREEGELWLRQIKIVREVYYDNDGADGEVQTTTENSDRPKMTEENIHSDEPTENENLNAKNIKKLSIPNDYALLALSADGSSTNTSRVNGNNDAISENGDEDDEPENSELESDVVVNLSPSKVQTTCLFENHVKAEEDGLEDIPEENDSSSSSSHVAEAEQMDETAPAINMAVTHNTPTVGPLTHQACPATMKVAPTHSSLRRRSTPNLADEMPTTTPTQKRLSLDSSSTKVLQTPRRLKQQSGVKNKLDVVIQRRRTTEVTRFDIMEPSALKKRDSTSSTSTAAVLINGMVALPSTQSLHRLDSIPGDAEFNMEEQDDTKQMYASASDFTVIFRNNVYPNNLPPVGPDHVTRQSSSSRHRQRPHSAFVDERGDVAATEENHYSSSSSASDDDKDESELDWHTPMSSFDRQESIRKKTKFSALVADRPPTPAFAASTAVSHSVQTTTTTLLTVNSRPLSTKKSLLTAFTMDIDREHGEAGKIYANQTNPAEQISAEISDAAPQNLRVKTTKSKHYRPQSMLELAATPVMVIGENNHKSVAYPVTMLLPVANPSEKLQDFGSAHKARQYFYGENNQNEHCLETRPKLCLISCEQGSLV